MKPNLAHAVLFSALLLAVAVFKRKPITAMFEKFTLNVPSL